MSITLSIILVFLLTLGGSPVQSSGAVSPVHPSRSASVLLNRDKTPGTPERTTRYYEPVMGRFLQTDPLGYQDSMNLYQGFNMNPVNFVDPMGMKYTKEHVDQLIRIRRDEGVFVARNWIDQNRSFTNEDKLLLHMMLWFGNNDPEKEEAEKYKTNVWTVISDTADGIGYDIAGKTWCKLAAAGLHHDSSALMSFLSDLGLAGISSGVIKHYLPIGIEFIKTKFPVLDKKFGELVGNGTEKVKASFNKLFGSSEIERKVRLTINERGWRVGDQITNLTKKGNVPSWNTIRQRYWKNKAYFNESLYSKSNFERMRQGLAPQRINPQTGLLESMELHHSPPRREGGLFSFIEVWPDDHALIDYYRNTGN